MKGNFIKGHIVEISLVGVVLLIHLFIALAPSRSLLNWYSNDDAYYYFKVARNISAGLGSSFDGISLTNGYHPLWLLICVPIFTLAKIDLVLPLRVLVMVSALITGMTGVLLYRLITRHLSSTIGIFIAVLWSFYSMIHAVVTAGGLEAGISSFFLTWLVYRLATSHNENQGHEKGWFRSQLFITGLIAAFAVMSRLDNIFFAILAGLWLVFENKKTANWLVMDIAVIPIFVIASDFIRIWLIAIFLLLKIPVFYLCGMYNDQKISIIRNWKRLAIAVILPAVLSFALLSAMQLTSLIKAFPRRMILLDIGLTLGWLLLTRFTKWSGFKAEPSHRFNIQEIKQEIWNKIPSAVSYALPNAILLGIYTGVNKVVFGTFTPVSGQVKHWWSTLNNTIYGRVPSSFTQVIGIPDDGGGAWSMILNLIRFPSKKLTEMLNITTSTGTIVLNWLCFALIVTIIFLLMRKNLGYWAERFGKLAIFPAFAGSLVQVLYYGISGYLHTRSWYWTLQLIFSVLIIAIALDAVRVSIVKATGERSSRWIFYLASLSIILSFGLRMVQQYPYQVAGRSENPFILMARELEMNTTPGSLIGTTGGGGLAYFIQGRTIVNLDGLMNSYEYFQMMQAGTADQFLDRIGLNYVHEKKYVVEETDPYRTFLPKHLKRIGRVSDFPLYEYIPGKVE